jgi:hypothetical protein
MLLSIKIPAWIDTTMAIGEALEVIVMKKQTK